MMQCNLGLFLTCLGAAAMGAFGLYLAYMAWADPQSPIVRSEITERFRSFKDADPVSRFLGWTREDAAGQDLWLFRFLGLFTAAVFFVGGIAMAVSEVRCGARLAFPKIAELIGPVTLRFDLSMLPELIVTVLMAYIGAYRQPPARGAVICLVVGVLGFALAEAAGASNTIEGTRWLAIFVGLCLAIAAATLLYRLARRRSP